MTTEKTGDVWEQSARKAVGAYRVEGMVFLGFLPYGPATTDVYFRDGQDRVHRFFTNINPATVSPSNFYRINQ